MSTGEFVPTPTYGLELEKVFSGLDNRAFLVGDDYFQRLYDLKQRRGERPAIKTVGDRIIGVTDNRGMESLDISFALGESSTGPIREEAGGLNELADVVDTQLRESVASLAEFGATILNMSNHPLTMINEAVYRQHVVPKPVYRFMIEERGWDHTAGINAKAQNSPNIGVPYDEAIDALNVSLAIGGAAIALFANSPFDQGRLTRTRETRLKVWEKIFSSPTFSGDKRMLAIPDKPFNNIQEYFKWMFSEDDTSMYFVVVGNDNKPARSEKDDVKILVVDGKPTLMEFMEADRWNTKSLNDGTAHVVEPQMHHFAAHQFTQFGPARIRFGFNAEGPDVKDFVDAMRDVPSELDNLLREHMAYTYIEIRDPGANFPDIEILEQGGVDVARSVVMSPSAFYAGTIRNIKRSKEFIELHGWDKLKNLREAAINDGLSAEYINLKACALTEELVDIAEEGLTKDEAWMLRYPKFVLCTGKNGADRAIDRFQNLREFHSTDEETIASIVGTRAIQLFNY